MRALVSYYAFLPGPGDLPAIPSPLKAVEDASGPLPAMLIARAGKDDPRLNASVDAFVRAALTRPMALDLLTLPDGRHAFDIMDDDDRSREVIQRTIAFLQARLR